VNEIGIKEILEAMGLMERRRACLPRPESLVAMARDG
jgi:hypothetical protein